MAGFNWSAFVVGIVVAIPGVVLSLFVARCLVCCEFALVERNVSRIWRLLLLCTCGFVACWASSVITWTLYSGKLHPVVTLLLIPYTFYAYLQIYRYESRRRGLRVGNYLVNRNWLIGITIPVILMFGLYPMESGMDAHAFFEIGVWIFYIGIAKYFIWFAGKDGYEFGTVKNLSGAAETILIFVIYIALAYYCWIQLHSWSGHPNF